jgi:cytochrome b involved in lipid metabolism
LNKSVIGAIIVVAVALVAGGIYWNSNKPASVEDSSSAGSSSSTSTSEQSTNNTGSTNSNQDTKSISEAEVAKHNSETDCWTIINDKVYDITKYIPRHPGGDEILKACGTDGSSMFNSRTTEDGQSIGSGTSHSANAQSQLNQFLVGDLSP